MTTEPLSALRDDRSPSAFSHRCRLPARAGIGFKPEHFAGLDASGPVTGFLEIHAENYMGAGGPPHRQLERLRRDYPLSLHGVGLSIGGAGPVDADHLDRLAALVARYQPASFSEHLAWSSHGPYFFNDLLPIAYDTPTLARVCDHIDETQEAMGRQMQDWIAASGSANIEMIGPAPCFFGRQNSLYRWQIILRAADPAALLRNRDLGNWLVEIDPPSLL